MGCERIRLIKTSVPDPCSLCTPAVYEDIWSSLGRRIDRTGCYSRSAVACSGEFYVALSDTFVIREIMEENRDGA